MVCSHSFLSPIFSPVLRKMICLPQKIPASLTGRTCLRIQLQNYGVFLKRWGSLLPFADMVVFSRLRIWYKAGNCMLLIFQ